MPFTEFWDWIQGLPLSQYIGFSYWFPLLESIHVLAIALVVGSIVWVDLRLLGVAGLRYPASRMTRELIPWTWAAFCVAAVTGTGLFMTRAGAYLENPAFQIKLGLLVLACVNMTVFQFRTFHDIASWDTARVPPRSAKLAGAASLLLWAGVVLAGRWTGHII
jgi:hypothetical protein